MSLKKQAISGVKWNFIQQFSVQIINFGVQVILARLLSPEAFGLIAMIVVLISIGQSLMDSGMTSSLIRTQKPDQADYSTVFVTNLLMSCMIYIIIYVTAPLIAGFYNQEILTDIIRLLALSFVIRAFVAVHITKLTKEMNFKLQMKLQIPSVLLSGIVGVSMAYLGYGVWSLVWLNLTQAIIFALQNWMLISWRPSFIFDREKFIYHFKFGYKLTISSLIDTIYNDAYRIVIGKFYSPTQVGLFNQAETMRLFPVQQISIVMGKVTYPYFANIDNDAGLRRAYRKSMKLVMFATIPIMLSLILVAEEGFRFVFGEKWLPAVPFFQVLAVASIVRPVSAYNLNILKVKGRSDLFLWVEILKKIIGILCLIVGLGFGLNGLIISLVAFSYSSYFINMYFSGKLLAYTVANQIKDIFIMLIVGSLMFTVLYYFKAFLATWISSDIGVIILIGSLNTALFISFSLLLDKDLRGIIKDLRS
ncbi:lipopolysaccharide biosynthesis protein [Alkanindiges illinoisensis]|uniref:lipopolysaccharide biosynthesis protein n=1 Tax=Alkanindiges illinoisensis TaxID=197183 RepID=UPI00047E4EBE|nr:lipopolysaccharide biosynthesis protein [Alkanindiges illinoisensis]